MSAIPVPAELLAGGMFVTGRIFDVYKKSESYTDKKGERVRKEPTVVEFECSWMNERGQTKTMYKVVHFSDQQVKDRVPLQFENLRGQIAAVPVMAYYERLYLAASSEPILLQGK